MAYPKVRNLPLEPGRLAWAHEVDQYGLPEGFSHNEPILIVEREERYYAVENTSGRMARLQVINIESAKEYQAPENGEWLPENHPRVLRWLEATIRKRETTPRKGDSPFLWNADATVTANYRGVLVRNQTGVPQALLESQRKFLVGQRSAPRGSRFAQELQRDYPDSAGSG